MQSCNRINPISGSHVTLNLKLTRYFLFYFIFSIHFISWRLIIIFILCLFHVAGMMMVKVLLLLNIFIYLLYFYVFLLYIFYVIQYTRYCNVFSMYYSIYYCKITLFLLHISYLLKHCIRY